MDPGWSELSNISYECPSLVDKSNWLGDYEYYDDTFEITQEGSAFHIRRVDESNSWSMNLRVACRPIAIVGPVSPGEACQSCVPGRHRDSASSTLFSNCTLCAPGRFAKQRAQVECKLCSAGTYAVKAGQLDCDLCPPGTTSSQDGSEVCELCPPGKSTDGSGVSCAKCDIGRFSRHVGSKVCTSCPAGTLQTVTGRTRCDVCPNSTYSTVGQVECSYNATSCPPGTAAQAPNKCRTCPNGHFNALVGGNFPESCKECPAGFFASKNQSSAVILACQQCPEGRYSDINGTSFCKHCAAGKTHVASGVRAPNAAREDFVL